MYKKLTELALFLMAISIIACGSNTKEKGFGLHTDPSKASDSPDVMATVDGSPITKEDVYNELKPYLKKFQRELFKMEEAGLETIINQKVLELAAKKENKSVEAYLGDYYKDKVKEPSEEDIKRYYDRSKDNIGKNYDQAKKEIADFIMVNQKNALERKLVNELRGKASVTVNLKQERLVVNIEDRQFIGKKDAPVTIVEFSDFQCPYCQSTRPMVKQLTDAYPNDVKYVFMDFPLSFHKNAPKAHEAAHCAADQGKYWKMLEIIFKNQKTMGVEDLKKLAKEVGLNANKFDKCLDSGGYAKKVQESIQIGSDVGVGGTPTFIVNGVIMQGRSFDAFEQTIEQELKRKM